MDIPQMYQYANYLIRALYQRRGIPDAPLLHITRDQENGLVIITNQEDSFDPPIKGQGKNIDLAISNWISLFDLTRKYRQEHQDECLNYARIAISNMMRELELKGRSEIKDVYITGRPSYTIIGSLIFETFNDNGDGNGVLTSTVHRMITEGKTLDETITLWIEQVEKKNMERVESQFANLSTTG